MLLGMEDQSNLNLEDLNARCEEYLNGWKRAKADFINYQRDEQKRLEEILKFGNENFVKELLTVLDSFVLSGETSPILLQLENILKKYGLEQIKVEIGQSFDPNWHEAIQIVKSDQPSNTIVEELEKGYTLHGKLIRPAKVKVAK